jgi:Na+-transporting methylmalonyl-CoA/oxaloacetate decarboxylase gamma subunit
MNEFFDFPNRLPTGEAWGLGGSVTALGVVVVFVALALLILLTFAYPKFFGWLLPTPAQKAKAAEKKAAKRQAKAQKKTAIVSNNSTELIASAAPADDTALIAVITAAIANSLGTSSNGIRIRSLRRSGSSTPAWGQEGRYEQFRY